MLSRLLRPRPSVVAGRALYVIAAAQARSPGFYLRANAPDTPEGRFELYLLHVVLLLRRLRARGANAAEIRQALFDAFLRGLDDGLREMGVGDLSVGKKMRKLGEAFYGRAKAYDAAFADVDPAAALRALLARTLYGELPDAGAADVASYALTAEAALERQPIDDLLRGAAVFPAFEVECHVRVA